ncbi:MAG TPA: hypothetical protein PKC54_09670 [Ferruginibacter sp.]|nr:hypothetical protein [Ferruginibacter sp.]
MKKNIFYLLAAIVLIFTSCAKIEVDGGGLDLSDFDWGGVRIYSNSFDTTAISFIQLPAYRYFIYKDSATGSLDSVVVTESYLSAPFVQATSNTPGYFYQTYSLTLTNFTATGIHTWYKGFVGCDSDYKNMLSFIDSDFSFSDVSTLLPSFWCPFTSSGAMQFTKIDVLAIEGNAYYNVYRFFATNGRPPSDVNYLATAFYWVKGTGIVKRETRTLNSIKTSLLLRHG